MCSHQNDVVFCKKTDWYTEEEKIGMGIGAAGGGLALLIGLIKAIKRFL